MSDAPPLVGKSVALERAERLVRGERIEEEAEVLAAGTIPSYYGAGATAADVASEWLRMWDRMKSSRPADEWFYLSNAIGWASRP